MLCLFEKIFFKLFMFLDLWKFFQRCYQWDTTADTTITTVKAMA